MSLFFLVAGCTYIQYPYHFLNSRYNHYKQRLEKLMEMMLLLTEVANLGNAISGYDLEGIDSLASDASTRRGLKNSSQKSLHHEVLFF